MQKGVNVEKPECVKWFNDLTNNGGSVSQTESVTLISYEPNDPYSFKPESKIQVRDYPRLTGCARDLQGRYRAIDQQGNIMPEVKQSDCKRWINGERLFDYTKQPQQVSNNAPVRTETNNSTINQPYIPPPQQAQNVVQAHLEARTVNGANAL